MSIRSRVDRLAGAMTPSHDRLTVYVYMGWPVQGRPLYRRPGEDPVYVAFVADCPDWLPPDSMVVIDPDEPGRTPCRGDLSPKAKAAVRRLVCAAVPPATARLVKAARFVVVYSPREDAPGWTPAPFEDDIPVEEGDDGEA